MFEKDYLMRFIRTLLNAISRIVRNINEGEIKEAQIQIDDSYRLLDNSKKYFLESDCKEITDFFKSKEGDYLKRVHLLAELLYLDASIEADRMIKRNKMSKAGKLFQHYLNFSKEYSLDISHKLVLIRKELGRLSVSEQM